MSTTPLRWVGRTLALIGLTSLLLIPAVAAGAQTNPYPAPTPGITDPCGGKGLPVIGQVNGVDVCGTVTAQHVQATATASPSGSMPFTGANIALLVGIGIVVLVGGVVLVRLSRRPNNAA